MAMQGLTQNIVQLMKSERLFKSQGGPIILSQIESEYGLLSKALGAPGYFYMTWAAKMVVELGTGVPWVMCKEDDTPGPVAHVFSSKEGGCTTFLTNHNLEFGAKVVYNNKHYNLPPWLISIHPDCKKVAIQLAFFLMFISFRL
ncbi:hypothetical protein GIB67_030168 [Kingdonia uniflora]|uniref:Beta-galactosidase beta-sandwich domain-containing protein n=1 Tax=Kingdonia uniflora TaxID=39325 RepID=A0A7J7LE98_9MAGN|nr:hypothetical protein GIB67_030168 [Kingdonia uniflora]